jgi:hypothetical protein
MTYNPTGIADEDTSEKKLTVHEWLKLMNEMGYFVMKQRIVEVPMGWKAVVVPAALIVAFGLALGITVIGADVAGKYFISCKGVL